MRKVSLFSICLLLMSSGISHAQKAFSTCSAAFIDKKMVVDEYSTKGKSALSSLAKGTLTVCTADISSVSTKPVEKIHFKVAIRDKQTRTLMMYSDQIFDQLNIQDVLKKCRKGDHIVLMTTDSQYALPHNEILVI